MHETGKLVWPPAFFSKYNIEGLLPNENDLPALSIAARQSLLDACLPLAGFLIKQAQDRQGTPVFLGINGGQGSGKSTMTNLLAALFRQQGRSVATLSIDDLYLTRHDRQNLAEKVHPLLLTRGVPGTHDLPLAFEVFDRLVSAKPYELTLIPRFNKAQDDREPQALWEPFTGRPDIVILEGWCVGAVPQHEHDLRVSCNALEREQDADGRWRHYVNQQLQAYQPLFERLDLLVMLKVPSFDQVYEWRELQEQKLREQVLREGLNNTRVMSPQEITHFISLYERLTRWMLEDIPGRADIVFHINPQHDIDRVHVSPAWLEE